MKKILIILSIALFSFGGSYAQDLDDLLDAELDNTISYTSATFKSTHIINSHSVAQLKKNHLNTNPFLKNIKYMYSPLIIRYMEI